MRAVVLAVLTVMVATPAAAAWQSGMIEDEGGPQMMAWVEGKGGDVPPTIYLNCAGEMGINLRYSMGSGPGELVQSPVGPFDFVFSFGGPTVTFNMGLEEYDGAYTAYFPAGDPVVELMRSSSNMTLSDPTGIWHEQVFSLEGSAKAIDAVLKACG